MTMAVRRIREGGLHGLQPDADQVPLFLRKGDIHRLGVGIVPFNVAGVGVPVFQIAAHVQQRPGVGQQSRDGPQGGQRPNASDPEITLPGRGLPAPAEQEQARAQAHGGQHAGQHAAKQVFLHHVVAHPVQGGQLVHDLVHLQVAPVPGLPRRSCRQPDRNAGKQAKQSGKQHCSDQCRFSAFLLQLFLPCHVCSPWRAGRKAARPLSFSFGHALFAPGPFTDCDISLPRPQIPGTGGAPYWAEWLRHSLGCLPRSRLRRNRSGWQTPAPRRISYLL